MYFFVGLVCFFIFNYSVAQQLDNMKFDARIQKEVLYGYCSIEGLKNFLRDDFERAKTYPYDLETIFSLRDVLTGTNVIIVLGTWCSDSKEHVPVFLQILETMMFPADKLTCICVDRSFDAAEAGYRPFSVERVPTFIFLDSDKNELGRIIERPQETLEKDIAKIFGK